MMLLSCPFNYKKELYDEFVSPLSVLNSNKYIELCQTFHIPFKSKVKLLRGKDFSPDEVSYTGHIPNSK